MKLTPPIDFGRVFKVFIGLVFHYLSTTHPETKKYDDYTTHLLITTDDKWPKNKSRITGSFVSENIPITSKVSRTDETLCNNTLQAQLPVQC